MDASFYYRLHAARLECVRESFVQPPLSTNVYSYVPYSQGKELDIAGELA